MNQTTNSFLLTKRHFNFYLNNAIRSYATKRETKDKKYEYHISHIDIKILYNTIMKIFKITQETNYEMCGETLDTYE